MSITFKVLSFYCSCTEGGLVPGWVLITCNLGAGPGASLVAGVDGGLVVGVCGVGGGVGGDGGLGGGDAHRSGAGGELHAIGAAVAAWVQWAAFH